jgi:hypothetical protein
MVSHGIVPIYEGGDFMRACAITIVLDFGELAGPWYAREWPIDGRLMAIVLKAIDETASAEDIERGLDVIAMRGGETGERILAVLERKHPLDLLTLEYPRLAAALHDVRTRRTIAEASYYSMLAS